MALINCPECGKPISDSANQCVHCGFRFVICPECKNAVSEDSKNCKYCGYELENVVKINYNEAKPSQETVKSILAKDQYLVAWEKSTIWGRSLKLVYRFGELLPGILGYLLLMIGLFIFFDWRFFNKENDLDKALAISSTFSNIKGLIISGSIFISIAIPFKAIVSTVRSFMFSSWMTSLNLNPIQGVKGYYKMKTSDEKYGNENLVIEAAYIKNEPSAKNTLLSVIVALTILSIAFWISLAACLCQNFGYYMNKTFLYGSFKLQFVPIIFTIIFYIAYKCTEYAGLKKFRDKEADWLEQTAPEIQEISAVKATTSANNDI